MRSIIDFYKYHFKYHKGEWIAFFVNLTLLIITLVSEAPSVTVDSIDVGMIVICGYFIFNIIWSLRDVSGFFINLGGKGSYEMKPTKWVIADRLSDEDVRNGYIIEESSIPTTGRVVRNAQVDRMLMDDSIRPATRINSRLERKVSDHINKNKDKLFLFLCHQFKWSNKKKLFFNEKKFCYSGDPITDMKLGEMTCHGGYYFDTFLTNITCAQRLDDENFECVVDGGIFFPLNKKDEEYHLAAPDGACMNNEIGISTLAITADNHIVVWRQSNRAQASWGKFAPSGSGSCDYRDHERHPDSFKDAILYAMNRELWEECKGDMVSERPEDFAQTMLLGYFRWVNKGGKPEFVGISRLRCRYSEISPDDSEVCYDKDTKEMLQIDKEPITEDNIIGKLDGFLERQGDNVSVPLWVCVARLKEALSDPEYSDRVKELFFDKKGLKENV